MDRINAILIGTLCLLLSACSKPANPTIKLAINPWPGYEFLYLAKEKGLYEKEGLNVEIIEAPSLAEVKRYFRQGKANAMTSTMIEAVTLAAKHQKQISIVLVADYSNGGDMILAKPNIADFSQIANKRVGVELGSLGTFFLHQALVKYNLTLNDIEMLNIEQLDASEAFDKDLIDAYVTYPPYANILQNDHDVKMVFNSRSIPETILDVVTVSSELLEQDPTWINRFHRVWQAALDYAEKHPLEANSIMAKREGINEDEFAAALTDLKILAAAEQKTLLSEQGLKHNMQQVCDVLNDTNSIEFDCTQLPQYLKIGTLSD
ncbi:ABC transporter substrate-binding protein [Pseudoalteromonas sp. G4]|uniref:ABC transporter substrate-binding protein n=1 Tax=Pseudoalteromonas sp. G4 TaxID=2992761 RepID=UPI00237E617B|nr:ABC transporter substrate-binding protein [Pseudoalteromonas sp. G4]MDE3272680.1 ABC transporter substrate-binding protein [Pseudoalteromonas sp. G4]